MFNPRACQLIRESFPVCPEHCRQPVRPSTSPSTPPEHTQTHVSNIFHSNREVSLEEAAALAGVTALLKSETLVSVNSNLAPGLPMSVHSAEQTHTHTHTPTRKGAEDEVVVLYGELISTVLWEHGDGQVEEQGKRGKEEGLREG